jgi:hypothetical protein
MPRYSGVARTNIFGPPDEGAKYVVLARTMLGELMDIHVTPYEDDGVRPSEFASREVQLPNGVRINVQYNTFLPQINIWVPATAVRRRMLGVERVLILAVGHASYPYVSFYRVPREGGDATPIELIAANNLPSHGVGKVFFSHDYTYFVALVMSAPYILVYVWDPELKQYVPKSVPPAENLAHDAAFTHGDSWNGSGTTLVVSLVSAPLMALYFFPDADSPAQKIAVPNDFLAPAAGPAWSVAISPNDRWLVFAHGGGASWVYSSSEACVDTPNFSTCRLVPGGIQKLAWYDNFCGALKPNEYQAGSYHRPWSGTAVTFSLDSSRMYLGTLSDRYGLFEYDMGGDIPSRIREMTFTAPNIAKSLAMTEGYRLGHTHWGDDNASIYNVASNVLVARATLGAQFESEHCAFSSDGYFAIASRRTVQPNVRLYKPNTYTRVSIVNPRTDDCYGVGFAEQEVYVGD